jgi:N-acyl-D-amino-acid deacylase
MAYDLKIEGGVLIDGTGAPRRRGDVGIVDGRIVALGDAPDGARRTLSAAGCVVAPGFVDVHTHYDAQILWDRMLTVSPWHGVTTAIMGNCGFTVAPTRPEHRDLILRTFERVEGMDLAALSAGMGEDWGFASFPEYLDLIEARGMGINVAAFIGHTALRLNVMGAAAVERSATDGEITAMRSLLQEALAAGAIGFSTSTSPSHHGFDGKPVPSRLADARERMAMAEALREAQAGIYYYNGTREPAWEEYAAIARASRRKVVWGVLLSGQLGPGRHRSLLQKSTDMVAAGLPLYPQVACRPIVFEFDLRFPVAFDTWAFFKPVREARTVQEQRALYRDPAYRQAFRDELAGSGGNDGHFAGGRQEGETRRRSFMLTEVSWYPPDRSLEGRKLTDIAAGRGVPVADLMFDLAVDTGLETRFRTPVSNFDEDEVEEILQDPNVIVGLGDGGAHASQLCDACYSTHLLGHWVRERKALTLERAVHMLSGRPAEVYGIADRGRLAPGMAADIVVFDPESVGAGPLERRNDFPGGAARFISRPSGIRAVVVNGTVLPPPGEPLADDSPLPGKLLRGGRAQR